MMRALLVLLCCLQHVADLADASLLLKGGLRASRGTVAERRAALLRVSGVTRQGQAPEGPFSEISSDKVPSELPEVPIPQMGVAGSPNLPAPLDAQTPESVANVLDYAIPMPTPLPAAFNGAYCRGGACQYRVAPPPPLPPTPIPMTPPPLPIGGNMLSGREFCRGLTCIGGMGAPSDPKLGAWNLNCIRLYNDIAGGMVGDDTSRTIVQAYNSFMNVCKLRVGPLEVGACPAYANVILGAEAAKVNSPTVGGAVEVCTDHYWFIVAVKQAEIDLKLTKAALPKGKSLLSSAFFRFGSGGNGPSSPRGLKWREWVYKRKRFPPPPAQPAQLGPDGGYADAVYDKSALVQITSKDDPTPKPPIPGADLDADTPRGLPKYSQNPPCASKKVHIVPQAATKYQIAPGSPDGVVPPTEVDGDLFTYCANQMSEIMMGFAQTAPVTVQMTKDWCAWQASVSSWVGQKDEFGHPDWTHRTCSNMQIFMAYVLKDNLADTQGGLSAAQVCKKIFLGIGPVHRTESIVSGAWDMQSTRAAPVGGGVPSGSDSGMADLMAQAQEAANKIFSMMRGQAAAYNDLNNAKMDTAAFDSNTVANEVPPPAPDLPDSDDLDVTALISLAEHRVRQSKRVASMTVSDELKPFGHGEAE